MVLTVASRRDAERPSSVRSDLLRKLRSRSVRSGSLAAKLWKSCSPSKSRAQAGARRDPAPRGRHRHSGPGRAGRAPRERCGTRRSWQWPNAAHESCFVRLWLRRHVSTGEGSGSARAAGFRRNGSAQGKARHLGQCVDSGVGAAGALRQRRLAGDAAQRGLQFALDGRQAGLHLPALEVGAVVGQGQLPGLEC